jgi:arylsulfatase A-like enzyme
MRRLTPFLLLLLAPLAPLPAAAPARPNLVVFLIDDMGVMDSSVPFLTDAAGRPQRHPLNEFYRTPAMERLAARGVRFSHFSAMSVCSPTRISIQNGQNAARHRTTNWINPNNDNAGPQGPADWNWRGLRRGDVTLARILQQAGYRTLHVGKGHFGPVGSEGADPLNLGFDVNVGGAAFGAPGTYYAKDGFGKNNAKRASSAVPGLEAYHGSETFLTEALTLEAKRHVGEAVHAGRPFFLYFPHYGVHSPFHSDPRFAAHYRDSGRNPQAQAFATLVEGVDKSLGDILDHLEQLGVAENTLVIFLGDNGSDAPLGHEHAVACAAPLRGKKGSHYEGGTRVPFLAAWARAADNPHQRRLPIPAGTVQTQPAAVMDLFPTLLGAAGLAAPAGHVVDGQPLDPLLSGRPDPRRQDTFLMHYPHAPHRTDYFTVYRDGPWKVIYHYVPGKASDGAPYQLVHLGDDPYEQRDLARERPADLRRMMQGLITSLERHGALYPRDPASGAPLRPRLP